MTAIRGYITNLGKYNEGELVGKWIDFPINDDELEEELKSIGVSNKPDKDGNFYEEFFFSDWETDLDGAVLRGLGEYEDVSKVNERAEWLESLGDDEAEGVAAFMDDGYSIDELMDTTIIHIGESGFSDSGRDRKIGEYYLEEVGLPRNAESYFDYEAFGRDVRLEYYPEDDDAPETAGEYYCGDENASDEEIGEALADDIGWDGIGTENVERYFDTEKFGRDIRIEGNFAEYHGEIYELVD